MLDLLQYRRAMSTQVRMFRLIDFFGNGGTQVLMLATTPTGIAIWNICGRISGATTDRKLIMTANDENDGLIGCWRDCSPSQSSICDSEQYFTCPMRRDVADMVIRSTI